jgi:SAM-dependent methyltransferase
MPPDRVFSQKSQATIRNILEEKSPDNPNNIVVLIGAGLESVYKKLCNPYNDIIRVGLPRNIEDVNVICDICDLPILEQQSDLIFSSSVLEHVYDPERAVAEMYRALKPNGYVYAEIPFMRASHMKPVDYQRYTIYGIEELFARHNFTLIDKGISSGPFSALALYIVDFIQSLLMFNKYALIIARLFLSLILHPFKYLDRICENSQWAETTACNFYYLGKKTI